MKPRDQRRAAASVGAPPRAAAINGAPYRFGTFTTSNEPSGFGNGGNFALTT
jgi:hypothetical protein